MISCALSARLTLRDLTDVNPESLLWSDASGACFGYLRESELGVQGACRSYEGLSIYTAELLAAADCLKSSNSKESVIFIDNQAALRALLKGHSSTLAGNIILRRLWECWEIDRRFSAGYVPTGCNKSDPLSRACGVYPTTQTGCVCEHVDPTKTMLWRGGAKKGGTL